MLKPTLIFFCFCLLLLTGCLDRVVKSETITVTDTVQQEEPFFSEPGLPENNSCADSITIEQWYQKNLLQKKWESGKLRLRLIGMTNCLQVILRPDMRFEEGKIKYSIQALCRREYPYRDLPATVRLVQDQIRELAKKKPVPSPLQVRFDDAAVLVLKP